MVITDISMPGVDGWTVASETRKRWPKTKLVIVTGYAQGRKATANGNPDLVDAFISKPFKIGEIDATVNKLLIEAQEGF
jgi:two-component system response regulator YesN